MKDNQPIPINLARKQLSKLISRALAGEEILIARGRTPVVRLQPIERQGARAFGALRGRRSLDSAFFEDLPENELKGWDKGSR